jgi:hypothetical protein
MFSPVSIKEGRWKRKDMVEHTDPKLKRERAVGKLEGPGTPSHSQRQSQTVDEEGVSGTISVGRGRTKVAHRVGGKVIGVSRKRVEVRQLRASENGSKRRAIWKARE